eukprot:TRINITY_DN23035_c0_g1_i1.p1 TRINITY_DN23035_c0_g1~~TRINITY_DN23035_c0_g1_i1.p1  ORF type:complete len:226 (+),score=2.01 TRINITY_DN23035_c0_g1_i1:3-680(+)
MQSQMDAPYHASRFEPPAPSAPEQRVNENSHRQPFNAFEHVSKHNQRDHSALPEEIRSSVTELKSTTARFGDKASKPPDHHSGIGGIDRTLRAVEFVKGAVRCGCVSSVHHIEYISAHGCEQALQLFEATLEGLQRHRHRQGIPLGHLRADGSAKPTKATGQRHPLLWTVPLSVGPASRPRSEVARDGVPFFQRPSDPRRPRSARGMCLPCRCAITIKFGFCAQH